MKKRRILWVILALCSVHFFQITATTIFEWNFNSAADDADTATGSLDPSVGTGVFALVGEATSTFGTVGGGRTSDPAVSDDSQVRVRGLPRIDAGNKSAGIELTLDTRGRENLTLSWDQFNSRTASRYWRVQYSIDGVSWTDHQSIINTTASTWTPFQVSFRDVPDVNSQPGLKIRIVQEFESTATGAGAAGYAAVDPTATYSTAGSWWIDMITISDGAIAPPNALPVVSAITNVTVLMGTTVDSIPFSISDAETRSDGLQVSALVSNPELIGSLFINGAGSNRFLTFQTKKVGETEITVRVTDEAGQFSETSFLLSIVSEPAQPPPKFFVLWNFNSASEDGDTATGSFEPGEGAGAFAVLATENHNFGTVAQGRTSDPATSDNSMVRISGFPRQGENAGTCGFEIAASTVGMGDVVLFWDQYNSGSASRHWQIQYSTNGIEFLELATFTNSIASTWQRGRSISLRETPGVANNPNFKIRFVSEFGADGTYAAVSEGSNYSTSGTLWLDMVGLSGEPLPPEPEPSVPPALELSNRGGLRLQWPLWARNYYLESREDWAADWVKVEGAAEEKDGFFQVQVETQGEFRIFRLRKD